MTRRIELSFRRALRKKRLAAPRISAIRQQKVDGPPSGMDRPVKEAISSFAVDLGFIQSPVPAYALQTRPAGLIHFRTVNLNHRQMQLAVIGNPHSAASCAMCANDIGYRRYQRTHHRIMAP
jgi:hypothetical protein